LFKKALKIIFLMLFLFKDITSLKPLKNKGFYTYLSSIAYI
jgi:hypothetical protein